MVGSSLSQVIDFASKLLNAACVTSKLFEKTVA